jgi:hypothetical protein
MANANVSASDVLFGRAAPIERSFRNKIVGLITLQTIGINIIGMPIALGTAALAWRYTINNDGNMEWQGKLSRERP